MNVKLCLLDLRQPNPRPALALLLFILLASPINEGSLAIIIQAWTCLQLFKTPLNVIMFVAGLEARVLFDKITAIDIGNVNLKIRVFMICRVITESR